MKRYCFGAAVMVLVFILTPAFSISELRAQTVPSDRAVVVRGLSLGSQQPLILNLASRYGLLRAEPDGMSTLVPELKAGLTSLAAHPEDSKMLLASGYTPEDDKLGVMMSSDGGESWNRISDGADGPAAFEDMDFARSDPDIVYGLFDGLQVSRDGGRSWEAGKILPDEVTGIAVSSLKADILYAASARGIFISRDGGAAWEPGYSVRRKATMVHTSPEGRVHAFVTGVGLITTTEPSLAWKTLSKDFADRYFLHMAADPADPNRLYATVDTGAIMTSGDGGKTWYSFEGSHIASAESIAKGKALFEGTCQACHGVEGIGESPDDPYAEDEFGFKAPALNDDAHAWHHSDQGLMASVLKGSPRNERMVAFEDTLSDEDVQNLIAYIKSLWNFRSLACQGGRHMACMGP